MSELTIALCVFGSCFASALVGMAIRLPERHRDQESKDVVKLVMGLIATIAALVLSLLVASANSSYNTQRTELQSLAANAILLDRWLVAYGPEANGVRDLLRERISSMRDRLWSPDGMQPTPIDGVTRFVGEIEALSPKTAAQRMMVGRMMLLGETVVHERLEMFEEAGSGVSWPVVVALIGWICLLFLGFGLYTQFNLTVVIALASGALSVSGAIFIILELNTPFSGLLQLSDAPVRYALSQMGH